MDNSVPQCNAVFLEGPRNVGKSTVITRTLEILTARLPLKLGGFYTWNNDAAVTGIFMRPAGPGANGQVLKLAGFDVNKGRLVTDIGVFENEGAMILKESENADLIIMDELGYLESNAPAFKRAVLDIIAGSAPVLGVLRQRKNIPWHLDIKSSSRVMLIEVTKENRDSLPAMLAEKLRAQICDPFKLNG